MEQEQNEHIRLFGMLMRKHEYLLHKICNKYGIYRGQHHILMALEETQGLTQNELSMKINVAKASMTTSLNRMEKHGFVYREKSSQDGRCNRIYITEKGMEASHGCSQEIDTLKASLFSQIDKKELVQLNDFLKKLVDGLDNFED